MRTEEHTLQLEVIAFFRNNYQRKGLGVIIPVPNEYTYKDKSAVIEKGASDLIVILKGRTIFIENKSKKGSQSSDQILFQSKVELLNYEYHICRSLEQFKEITSCEKE